MKTLGGKTSDNIFAPNYAVDGIGELLEAAQPLLGPHDQRADRSYWQIGRRIFEFEQRGAKTVRNTSRVIGEKWR
jgi:hypothetical protein